MQVKGQVVQVHSQDSASPLSWLIVANTLFLLTLPISRYILGYLSTFSQDHHPAKVSKSALDHAMEESSPGLTTTTDPSDSPLNPATSQRVVALSNDLSPTETPE